jgi:hypothetical protein
MTLADKVEAQATSSYRGSFFIFLVSVRTDTRKGEFYIFGEEEKMR